jgi:hypothetical protein
MVVGAVTYDCKNSFLHHFNNWFGSLRNNYRQFWNRKSFVQRCQQLKKSLFEKLNGFEGNDSIASEMMFLLQKAIARFPGKVHM